jgi:hypothetical protein
MVVQTKLTGYQKSSYTNRGHISLKIIKKIGALTVDNITAVISWEILG